MVITHLQVAFSGEGSTTNGTLERLVASVRSHVNLPENVERVSSEYRELAPLYVYNKICVCLPVMQIHWKMVLHIFYTCVY